jgi:hypothetical protein
VALQDVCLDAWAPFADERLATKIVAVAACPLPHEKRRRARIRSSDAFIILLPCWPKENHNFAIFLNIHQKKLNCTSRPRGNLSMNSKSSLRWTCCRCRHDYVDKNWNPQRCTRTRRTDRVLRILTRVAAFSLASTSSLLISRYDPAWDRRRSSQPSESSGRLSASHFRLPKV